MTTRSAICLIPLGALAGCAGITPHLGFERVQQEVSDRAGLQVRWDTGSEADQDAKAAIASLLDGELTAEKAMQVALLNNRELQAVYEELHIAQADLVQAGLLKNPVFSGDLRFGAAGGPPAVEMSIAQDFISLLAMPLRKARAQAAFETEKLRVSAAVLDLAGDVRAAFYEAQATEQLREMRQTVLEATTASYELARRLHEAGNFRDLDVSNERALNEQSKLELGSAELQVRTTRERLNELMGLWGTQTEWKITPRLPEIPATASSEAENLEGRAIARSLDLKIAEKEIEVAARTLGITQTTKLMKEASIGISVQREVSDNRGVRRERRREWYNLIGEAVTRKIENQPLIWPPLSPHGAAQRYDGIWSLGPSASMSIPLFDQGQAAVTSDQARLKQSLDHYFALAVRLRARSRSIALTTEAARDKAAYYQKIVIPLRHKIVEETQLQYNAMQVSAFQLLQARRDEITAGAEYIEELRGYWVARARLDLILNGRMPSRWRDGMASDSNARNRTNGGQHDDNQE